MEMINGPKKSGLGRLRMIRPKSWSKGDLTILTEEHLFQSLGTRNRTGGKGLKLQREGIRLDMWKVFFD